jgi:hypothetical protein
MVRGLENKARIVYLEVRSSINRPKKKQQKEKLILAGASALFRALGTITG